MVSCTFLKHSLASPVFSCLEHSLLVCEGKIIQEFENITVYSMEFMQNYAMQARNAVKAWERGVYDEQNDIIRCFVE